MKPIEAEIHYKDVAKDDNGDVIYEDGMPKLVGAVGHGVITDIVVMKDNGDKGESDEAYALFFEDKNGVHTPRLELLSDIRVTNSQMRKYINSFYE